MNNFALGIYNICLDRSHKLLIFKEYHGEYVASSESEFDSPTPLTRLRVRGWGSPNSDDWKKA
jgi:hypothetical protein